MELEISLQKFPSHLCTDFEFLLIIETDLITGVLFKQGYNVISSIIQFVAGKIGFIIFY